MSEMVRLVSRSNLEEMVSSKHLRKPKNARMNMAFDERSILMASEGQTLLNVGWKK